MAKVVDGKVVFSDEYQGLLAEADTILSDIGRGKDTPEARAEAGIVTLTTQMAGVIELLQLLAVQGATAGPVVFDEEDTDA